MYIFNVVFDYGFRGVILSSIYLKPVDGQKDKNIKNEIIIGTVIK